MSAAGTKVRRCAICGSTDRVEVHHVGGRHHIAWFSIPLCGGHHDRVHVLLGQENFRYTADPVERCIRVLKAVLVFAWIVVEGLLCHLTSQRRGGQHERNA